jgi:hypothetical protein
MQSGYLSLMSFSIPGECYRCMRRSDSPEKRLEAGIDAEAVEAGVVLKVDNPIGMEPESTLEIGLRFRIVTSR